MQVADIRDDIDYELISHEDLMKRIREVAKQVSEDYKNRNILLVAVLKGA
ncbi:hypoxanthine phosphoribosyltransferase, partial [Bifidobacteriaceae bacterium WP012]